MKVSLELFGQLTDLAQQRFIELDTVEDTDSVMQKIYEMLPALRSAKFFIAVNNRVINKNTMLSDGARIALMPPYSGG